MTIAGVTRASRTRYTLPESTSATVRAGRPVSSRTTSERWSRCPSRMAAPEDARSPATSGGRPAAPRPVTNASSSSFVAVTGACRTCRSRWPQLGGTYPDGPGPEVRTQAQLAQLVALGRTLLVVPASSRAWQWPDHVAVPVVDAVDITTVIAWRPSSRSPAVDAVVRAGAGLRRTTLSP